jgi:hypothetical protein
MKRIPRTRETSSNFSDSIQRQLNMYAVAAGAAGVGILALAQNAEARIVYTPAHKTIGSHSTLSLDLNHDGVVDFTLSNSSEASVKWSSQFLSATGQASGNEVWGESRYFGAAALRAGTVIRNNLRFGPGKHQMAVVRLLHPSSRYTCRDPWVNVKNRYLGLKFVIKGKTHFGWARLSVTCSTSPLPTVGAVLTGYAYETTPNKAIIAGKTKGADDGSSMEQPDPVSLTAPAPEPATLGLLAMGAPGLSIWRREESVGAP